VKTNNRHLDVLEAICAFQQVHGVSPSYQNIMDLTGIKTTSNVAYYLKILEHLEMIDKRFFYAHRNIDVLKSVPPSQKMLSQARKLKINIYNVSIDPGRENKEKTAGLQVPVRKGKRGKAREISLLERIDAIVAEAKSQDTGNAGVDMLYDFRRSFTPKFSIRATKIG